MLDGNVVKQFIPISIVTMRLNLPKSSGSSVIKFDFADDWVFHWGGLQQDRDVPTEGPSRLL